MEVDESIAGRFTLGEALDVPLPHATAFRATDTRLDVPAVVIVATGSRATAFLSAARRARLIRDFRLARILDADSLEGASGAKARVFVAFEQPEGRDLASLASGRSLPIDDARALALGVADALSTASKSGLRHGALAPALLSVGPHGRVVLTGAGVISALGSPGTTPRGAPGGTRGGTGVRVDADALARLFFSWATGIPAESVGEGDLGPEFSAGERRLARAVLTDANPPTLAALVSALAAGSPPAERAERLRVLVAHSSPRRGSAGTGGSGAAALAARAVATVGAAASAAATAATAAAAAAATATGPALKRAGVRVAATTTTVARKVASGARAGGTATARLAARVRAWFHDLAAARAAAATPRDGTPRDGTPGGPSTDLLEAPTRITPSVDATAPLAPRSPLAEPDTDAWGLEVLDPVEPTSNMPTVGEAFFGMLVRRFPESNSFARRLQSAHARALAGPKFNPVPWLFLAGLVAAVFFAWVAINGITAPFIPDFDLNRPSPQEWPPYPPEPTPSPTAPAP